jgi:glycerophosphoryl diester phosphodiesterase
VLPENTVRGFEYAIELGCDYAECDVHLTRDSRLIVMHDTTVDRTTDGAGAIGDMTFAEIRALDAGDGLQVPTFVEVLSTTSTRIRLLCELKGEGVVEAAVGAVTQLGLQAQVVFTSFNMDRLRRVKEIDDTLEVGAILPNPSDDDIPMARDLGATAIGVQYKNMSIRRVEQALDLGMHIRAWNPDELHEMKAMLGLGVSGVSSNRPDILVEHLRAEGLR